MKRSPSTQQIPLAAVRGNKGVSHRFGAEVLFLLLLGLLVIGPEQLHVMLGQLARAKLGSRMRPVATDLSSRRSSMGRRRKATRIVP